MKDSIYSGTNNLNIKVAVNRLIELLDKAPLGDKDEKYYIESKNYLNKNLDDLIKSDIYWSKSKDSLSAKQLLKLL